MKRGCIFLLCSNNFGITYDYVDVNTMIIYDGKKNAKSVKKGINALDVYTKRNIYDYLARPEEK